MSKKQDIRAHFRDAVFTRDRYTCRVCGRVWSAKDADPALGRIDAHHVLDRHLFPNGGYVMENGITVCAEGEDSCHMKCEQYHITGTSLPGLHPDDLYGMIGSSLDAAIAADDRLNPDPHR